MYRFVLWIMCVRSRSKWTGIRGVYLDYVEAGGAADRAGLKRGDVVLALNGRIVNEPNEMQSAIALMRHGRHRCRELPSPRTNLGCTRSAAW